jgi:hypothetical protein
VKPPQTSVVRICVAWGIMNNRIGKQARPRTLYSRERGSRERVGIALKQAFPLPQSGEFSDLLEAINSEVSAKGKNRIDDK